MSIFRRVFTIFALTMSTFLFGCASINKASLKDDAEAKAFKPNPAVSQLYVYRNETLGAALSMEVTVDGKLAGTTGPKSYFKFDLPAGKHTLTSQRDSSELGLITELGKIYYVWQEMKMGVFVGASKLQLVSEEVGKKGVLECSQIQANPGVGISVANKAPSQSTDVAKVAAAPPAIAKPAVTATQSAAPAAVLTPVPVVAVVGPSPAKPDTSATNPLNDAEKLPLSIDGREAYRQWLTKPLPRAFAVAANGVWLAAWGTKPQNTALPTNPSERALQACQNRAKEACKLYAVDNEVVWSVK
jgi:Protein of unknown function (DUF2846)